MARDDQPFRNASHRGNVTDHLYSTETATPAATRAFEVEIAIREISLPVDGQCIVRHIRPSTVAGLKASTSFCMYVSLLVPLQEIIQKPADLAYW